MFCSNITRYSKAKNVAGCNGTSIGTASKHKPKSCKERCGMSELYYNYSRFKYTRF